MKKILIASDAWFPQINGVVRSIEYTIRSLTELGCQTHVIHPGQFFTLPNLVYPEIPLALPWPGKIDKAFADFKPDSIHICTEGPIGCAVRRYCLRRRLDFSTSFHTMFPDYFKKMLGIPPTISWGFLRNFHRPAKSIMVPTVNMIAVLKARGFDNLTLWTRGVDTALFDSRGGLELPGAKPIMMYVGRVSKEKNIEDFLDLDLPGTKYVVGDGPQSGALKQKYPQVVFAGYRQGAELAAYYASADVLVFPSRTDTFGNVLIEALACGTPVAAYPEPGPCRLIVNKDLGAYSDNLREAVQSALKYGNPQTCRQYAEGFSWKAATRQFLSHLVPLSTKGRQT